MDGSAASAKLLGDLDTFVLGRASLHVQPNTWFHAMGDHVVTFSLLPLAADKTLVRTTWLVAPDAEEGVDYDLENLTTVWIKTNEQDAHFCELAQSGVSSPAYEPGPYAPTESQVDDFVTWYIERLKAHRDATDSRGEGNSDEVPSLESAVGRRIVGRRSTAGGEGDIPRARARHSPEVGGTADSVGRAAWRADCCRADPTRGTVGRADGCCTCRSCRTCRSRRPRTAHGPRRCRGHHRGDPRREDLRAAGGLDDLRRLRTRPIRDHARARARPRTVLFDLLGAVRDEYVHHHGQARGRRTGVEPPPRCRGRRRPTPCRWAVRALQHQLPPGGEAPVPLGRLGHHTDHVHGPQPAGPTERRGHRYRLRLQRLQPRGHHLPP